MKYVDYTEIGKKIKQARMENEMSQEMLASKCDISTSFLGHIERGTRKMSLETFLTICSELNLSTDYVLSDELPNADATVLNIIHSAKRNGKVQYEKYLTIIKALAQITDKL